jgi:hypothetical protein
VGYSLSSGFRNSQYPTTLNIHGQQETGQPPEACEPLALWGGASRVCRSLLLSFRRELVAFFALCPSQQNQNMDI